MVWLGEGRPKPPADRVEFNHYLGRLPFSFLVPEPRIFSKFFRIDHRSIWQSRRIFVAQLEKKHDARTPIRLRRPSRLSTLGCQPCPSRSQYGQMWFFLPPVNRLWRVDRSFRLRWCQIIRRRTALRSPDKFSSTRSAVSEQRRVFVRGGRKYYFTYPEQHNMVLSSNIGISSTTEWMTNTVCKELTLFCRQLFRRSCWLYR